MADFEVIFMDAGQGDCTLICYPDNTVTLVDCGSTKSGTQAFEGIKKIAHDRLANSGQYANLVLTHPDEDHYNLIKSLDKGDMLFDRLVYVYYGGSSALYQNKKDNDYTYQLLRHCINNGIAGPPKNTASLVPDDRLSRAGVNVTILAANCTGNRFLEGGPDKNTNSIVLLVEYEGAKIFLMGDAFVKTEKFITKVFRKANALHRLQKQPGEHVVLKMGHHGSDTSTGSDWVKLIQPDVIVVSAGTRIFNGTGMPKETHLNATINATTLEANTGITQSYVVYDDTLMAPVFAQRPVTTRGIWTTCYEATWDPNVNNYLESGQSWYYGVELQGKKKIPGHWYGYTGYEDPAT